MTIAPQMLEEFSGLAERQLFGHILPFWTGAALDREHGGWHPWMSNDLRVDAQQPQGLILNCRLLWTFAAVHRFRPSQLCKEMAERALDIVVNQFWDRAFGGAFWRLRDGKPVDVAKKTYGQAFYVFALAEYHRAFDAVPALTRAVETFEAIERHARDPAHGGYLEVRRRNWLPADDSRLSEKDMDEKKSMNTHLHVLEAYTNLYRVWKNVRVERCLRELLEIFERRILDARAFHLHHFFDEQWSVHSDTYTFGHDIEASWLLCEAAEILGDAAVLERARQMAQAMAETVLREGRDSDGGLFYEGKAGQIVDRGKEWWPQAEAVVGFLNAYELSSDARYLQAARALWDYIEEKLVDRRHGEWFWRIAPDGQPDLQLPKVSEWKDPYHASRACLETLRRLSRLNVKKQTLPDAYEPNIV